MKFVAISSCFTIYLWLVIAVVVMKDDVVVSANDGGDEIIPDEYILDDHWNYSTHLNDSNFVKVVKDAIDHGKTMFVRWTAGLYCGSCAKQAQGWDDVVRLFAHHPNIVFGDVDVKEKNVQKLKGSPHNPGLDGWPSIRYFNQQTGINGMSYVQKTKMRKWEELGPDHMFLIEFIEEISGTPLCDVMTGKYCDDKSKEFLKSISNNKTTPFQLQRMLEDVHVMESDIRKSNSKKRDLWLVQQKHLLLQLVGSSIFSNNNNNHQNEL